jgi:hypothetical protein
MPFVRGFLRVLTRDRFGRPVDPGYGVDEGDGDGGEIGGGPIFPGHPGNRPPGSWTGRPSHPIERPPWERPAWPPGPTDPDFGVPEDGGGENAGQLPGELPPDGAIPPGDLTKPLPKPPADLPPGSVWPPLPPTAPPGTHWFLVYISGVGHRYGKFVVPDTPPPRPQPDPGEPEVDPTRR